MWLKEGIVCERKGVWGQVLDLETKIYFFSIVCPPKHP